MTLITILLLSIIGVLSFVIIDLLLKINKLQNILKVFLVALFEDDKE